MGRHGPRARPALAANRDAVSGPPRFDCASARDVAVMLLGLAGVALMRLGRFLSRD